MKKLYDRSSSSESGCGERFADFECLGVAIEQALHGGGPGALPGFTQRSLTHAVAHRVVMQQAFQERTIIAYLLLLRKAACVQQIAGFAVLHQVANTL